MDNTTAESKKGFLQNDRRLVCSLLVFYALCLFGLIGAALWGLNQGRQFYAEQHANATATAIARVTEQSQFEVIESFDNTAGQWRVGKFKNHHGWDGSLEVKEGVYVWTVDKVQRPFLDDVEFFQPRPIKDFEAYVDTRLTGGTEGNSCSGFVFHRSFQGWGHGAYIFIVCNDSTFQIAYYDEGGWESLSGRHSDEAILARDWNRLEISAFEDYFIFSINHKAVYFLKDDHQTEGALGLLVQISDTTPTIFWFDNFGFQSQQRGQNVSENATAMAQIIATLDAEGTTTAVAHATQLADYEFFDPFDVNINRWRTGAIDNENGKGSAQITSGVYIWKVTEVKKKFVDSADFPGADDIRNYDVSVDTKFYEAPTDHVCSGLIFRKSLQDAGKYSFVVCKAGLFVISHYNKEAGWEVIDSEAHPSIQPSEWNHLEVRANNSRFVFLINNEVVYETNDERQPVGSVALMIDAQDPETKILFDNFSFQSR